MSFGVRGKSWALFTALAISFSTLLIPAAQAAAPWGSIYFDGTQYLSSTNMSAPGTGTFTYELWFKNTATSAGNQTLMNSRQSVGVGQQKDGFDLAITSTRSMYASYKSLAFFNTGDGSIELNRWYHFALVRTGNTTYGYLDGNLIASQALAGDGLNFFSQRLWIGTTANLSNKFTGHISNFRYTKSDLYSANFTPPTDENEIVTNTSILLRTENDATFITNSVAGTTFTNNGGATASSENPFVRIRTQSEIDAEEVEKSRKARAERDAAIRAARERLALNLQGNIPITTNDLIEADVPLKSIDSLLAAYNELLAIKKTLKSPLTTEAATALKAKTVMKYVMIERISGISTGDVFGRDLVKYGLLEPSTPMKQLTAYRLSKLPVTQKDSLKKIEEYFKKSAAEFASRSEHLVSIIAKIQGR